MFDRLLAPDRLWEAWFKVLRNRGGPGGDGESLDAFRIGVETRLARLAADVRGGTWRPGPYRLLDVPKDDGGTRRLAIPCVADRVLMTSAALVMGPMLDATFEPSSHGYRPGRGVRTAIARVESLRDQGFHWVLDADITRFFDRVPHDRLLDRLREATGDARLVDLVGLWLDGYDPTGEAGRGGGLGLPQGAPISPLLANLYLDTVDERIAAAGLHLVRFADDFVILAADEAAAEGARAHVAALLADHGLHLHPDKTRVVSFDQGFAFLGKLFVRALVLPRPDDDPTPKAVVRPATAPPAPDPIAMTPGDPEASPILRPLYVVEPGRRLSVRNQAFTVEEIETGRELIALPAARVGRIDLGHRVAADARALRHAAAARIPVALLDGLGGVEAWLEPDGGARGQRHLAQARHILNPDSRLTLARLLVDARLQTTQALLKRLNRRKRLATVDAAADRLKRIRRKLPLADDIPQLMGHEGEAAAIYWPALGALIDHGWVFRRRLRRDAADPVNLILDWLAALLAREIKALASRHALDPGLGVLHEVRDGHDALVSDLIEIFRAPLAEACTVYLFNNRILGPDDIIRYPPPPDAPDRAGVSGQPDGGWRVLPEAGRRVIRTWEGWLDRPVTGPDGRRRAWRGLIDAQLAAWCRHIEDDAPFVPYHLDY